MLSRRHLLLASLTTLGLSAPLRAAEPIKVVASFSILGDLVANVGKDRIQLTTLVGPNGDAHVYQPKPADAKAMAEAGLIISNGLAFEGWMDRLIQSSGAKAKRIEAAAIITPMPVEHDKDEKESHDHGHDHGEVDPHAWQDIGNAKLYVKAIKDALISADPAGQAAYEANATAYLARLDTLDAEIKAAVASLPPERRKVITSHDAFGYFAKAYGINFVAPTGVSTEAEVSAKSVARIIRQIKKEKISALFMENISDERLLRRIADETGVAIGGTLFSDALSDDKGPAATYIDMMKHNASTITSALAS